MTAAVMTWLGTLPALLLLGAAAWAIATARRNVGLVDVFWSLFMLLAASIAFLRSPPAPRGWLVLALTAAVLVASLIVHMWRHARTIKRDIEHRLSVSAAQVGIQAAVGVFLFTLLMITREGMETALLMGTLVAQGSGAINLLAGASLGVLAAAAMARAPSAASTNCVRPKPPSTLRTCKRAGALSSTISTRNCPRSVAAAGNTCFNASISCSGVNGLCR